MIVRTDLSRFNLVLSALERPLFSTGEGEERIVTDAVFGTHVVVGVSARERLLRRAKRGGVSNTSVERRTGKKLTNGFDHASRSTSRVHLASRFGGVDRDAA